VLRQINLRLQEIRECDLPFGGFNILLMGDLLQIEPVHGNWIYDQPSELQNEENLWRLFQIQQLIQNVRQMEIGLMATCVIT
jgi:hypothetical protein